MTQNIYDNPDFLAGYSQLPRSVVGLAGAPEWLSLQSLLPDVAGAKVLDLGCGFGWFCEWAAAAGASRVVGLDVSASMLERANRERPGDAITYERCDLEELAAVRGQFDLIYSSLTLQYIADLKRLFEAVARSMPSGAAFVFSIEHPMHTAPANPEFVEHNGRIVWPVDRYLDEGPRTTNWFTEGVIKYHRTTSTYVNALIEAGFTIASIEDWGPTTEQVAEHPDWASARESPLFLLVAATRR